MNRGDSRRLFARSSDDLAISLQLGRTRSLSSQAHGTAHGQASDRGISKERRRSARALDLTVRVTTADLSSASGPLVVEFSQPLQNPHIAAWRLSPNIHGRWRAITPQEYAFRPSAPFGFGPGIAIHLYIPKGLPGPIAKGGTGLAKAVTLTWQSPAGSVLRLQELLADEGYLPVTFTPTAPPAAHSLEYEVESLYRPPEGTFTWKYPNLPAQLKALWTVGSMNVITQGALMQFQRAHNMTPNGVLNAAVWRALILDRLHHKVSPYPYTYIWVTETEPETLELWVDNRLVLTTLCNTGIPQSPTELGTFPIYERLPFQVMQGVNPFGQPYADPVHWINYFYGGDAVHGFVRAAYGFPQSLGCVEVPVSVAPLIYQTVHYGTLVTVNPVGVPVAPGH
jgi:peptidoglycan hydrolase-like protein with peptidoglycan-binding domain